MIACCFVAYKRDLQESARPTRVTVEEPKQETYDDPLTWHASSRAHCSREASAGLKRLYKRFNWQLPSDSKFSAQKTRSMHNPRCNSTSHARQSSDNPLGAHSSRDLQSNVELTALIIASFGLRGSTLS